MLSYCFVDLWCCFPLFDWTANINTHVHKLLALCVQCICQYLNYSWIYLEFFKPGIGKHCTNALMGVKFRTKASQQISLMLVQEWVWQSQNEKLYKILKYKCLTVGTMMHDSQEIFRVRAQSYVQLAIKITDSVKGFWRYRAVKLRVHFHPIFITVYGETICQIQNLLQWQEWWGGPLWHTMCGWDFASNTWRQKARCFLVSCLLCFWMTNLF